MWGEIDPPVGAQPRPCESEKRTVLPEEPAAPVQTCDLYIPKHRTDTQPVAQLDPSVRLQGFFLICLFLGWILCASPLTAFLTTGRAQLRWSHDRVGSHEREPREEPADRRGRADLRGAEGGAAASVPQQTAGLPGEVPCKCQRDTGLDSNEGTTSRSCTATVCGSVLMCLLAANRNVRKDLKALKIGPGQFASD